MSVAIPRELGDAGLSLDYHLKSLGMPDPRILPQTDHLVAVGAGNWKGRIPTIWRSWEVWHRAEQGRA